MERCLLFLLQANEALKGKQREFITCVQTLTGGKPLTFQFNEHTTVDKLSRAIAACEGTSVDDQRLYSEDGVQLCGGTLKSYIDQGLCLDKIFLRLVQLGC